MSEPEAATSSSSSSPRRASWPARVAFGAALVLLAGAIPVLAWFGKEAVLESSEGRAVGAVTDPTAPGYEAIVEPTDTLLMVQTDGSGSLVGLTFLALSSEETGSALFIPVTTAVELPEYGPVPLRDAWEQGGLPPLTQGVESVLGVGIAEFADDGTLLQGEIVEAGPDRWAQLVEPVAPLKIDNPELVEVVDAEGRVQARFPEGEIELEAAAVPAYLEARRPGENDLNRLARHRELWESWTEAIREQGPETAIPGEQDTGLGRFVLVLAGGESGFVVMPATTYRVPGTDEDMYLPVEDRLESIVEQMVPFPVAPVAGGRTTLKVLDGTGTPGAAREAALQLVEDVDGEVRVVGNGPSFDVRTTRILYFDPTDEEAAREVREALGAGEIELRRNPDEAVMVEVVLGSDVVGGLNV